MVYKILNRDNSKVLRVPKSHVYSTFKMMVLVGPFQIRIFCDPVSFLSLKLGSGEDRYAQILCHLMSQSDTSSLLGVFFNPSDFQGTVL